MSITIKAYRPLSECLGQGKMVMEWDGGTLEELIRSLVEKKGAAVAEELYEEDGSLAYLVSINGKIHRQVSAAVRDGDEIFFFTPLGGG